MQQCFQKQSLKLLKINKSTYISWLLERFVRTHTHRESLSRKWVENRQGRRKRTWCIMFTISSWFTGTTPLQIYPLHLAQSCLYFQCHIWSKYSFVALCYVWNWLSQRFCQCSNHYCPLLSINPSANIRLGRFIPCESRAHRASVIRRVPFRWPFTLWNSRHWEKIYLETSQELALIQLDYHISAITWTQYIVGRRSKLLYSESESGHPSSSGRTVAQVSKTFCCYDSDF